ncbi:MAG: LD-carboxypeptidase [Propionibacteriaceae bacterium]|jgi:muramoyltetrapeptide carboxypeptidase LdcA involved in peptidoglycan recycling|nr:LD-carboxypeptidase [Propionibacteriaceae bacterium]
MKRFPRLPKAHRGDRVAVLSPSAGPAGVFPWVHELGVERLRRVVGVEPVEYPTTRQVGASHADRARDLMDTVADPTIAAVIATVGGDDEIGLIKHLDPEVFRDHPKPFFGYSDNTNLHNFLWRLGVRSYYGCSTMVQLAMPTPDPLTFDSLKRALFESGDYEIPTAEQFTEVEWDWSDRANPTRPHQMEPNDGPDWDVSDETPDEVAGVLWGGCCEVLHGMLAAGHPMPGDDDLAGGVLYLETSEVILDPFMVGYLLAGFGERGWLDRFSAILVGRAKAWAFDKPRESGERTAYPVAQREAVRSAVRSYNPTIPIVQNLDFGHTDPQVIIPNGGLATVLTGSRRVIVEY